MKEATGEVSMTVVTLIAIAVIGGILAIFWGLLQIKLVVYGVKMQHAHQDILW